MYFPKQYQKLVTLCALAFEVSSYLRPTAAFFRSDLNIKPAVIKIAMPQRSIEPDRRQYLSWVTAYRVYLDSAGAGHLVKGYQ